ncbi:hypothetical protein BEWA_027070 [Theileria equi strain WA]|uniref:CRAL-TRIO domain-containing protein n=1 Tax=Theileria equi strain WA TaxID=1537102 RepID=L0AX84_THEEQ|nr:hypothetical protein BEWA_027070 [Theileria equi strain WA]AFZ79858.1 hypothetical protein BEWA_027070 [Theileria equi strain WA]|eukprot:XP_004829524.1 hypothetical protein BEWA_027070 [Theileria equi strain WA]
MFRSSEKRAKNFATDLTPEELEGLVQALSEEQKALLHEIKQTFMANVYGNELLFDDLFFVRFLRARSFDLKKTTVMLNKYFAWRTETDVPRIITTDMTEIREKLRVHHPHAYHGVDKMGRPIYIERIGLSNPSKALHELSTQQLTEYYVQRYEYRRTNVMIAKVVRVNVSVRMINKLRYNLYELWIDKVTYGGKDLQIEDNGDGQSQLLSVTHTEILEATTYYSIKHDTGERFIKVPLAIRVQDARYEGAFWYENKGGNNLTWKSITSTGDFPRDDPGQGGNEFIDKLNDLTCQLHNLHSVNIHENGDFKRAYYCPCGQANVTIEPTSNYTPTGGYICYLHTYDPNVTRVIYRSTLLEWRMSTNDDKYAPFSLNQQTPTLYVFYWDKDKKCTRPLIIGVYVGKDSGGIPVPVCNDGYSDNSKWTMIPDRVGEHVFAGTLHEQKCRLFRPVDINISEKGPYANKYCQDRICTNDGCPKNVQVSTHSLSNINGYTAKKHTYGGKPFTITGFRNGLSLQELTLPIWDVTEVVVFFSSSCGDTNTPLLVYASSDGGSTKKWYSRTRRDMNEWQEERGKLKGENPETANSTGNLKIVLEKIKGNLKLHCQGTQGSGSEIRDSEEENKDVQMPPPPPLSGTTSGNGTISTRSAIICGTTQPLSGLEGSTITIDTLTSTPVPQSLFEKQENDIPTVLPVVVGIDTFPVKGSGAPLSLPGKESHSVFIDLPITTTTIEQDPNTAPIKASDPIPGTPGQASPPFQPQKPNTDPNNNIKISIGVPTGFLVSHVMLPAASLKSGKRVEQLLTILDLRGFQMSQINTKLKAFLSAMTLVTQNYYPELLGKLLFVNTPGMFSALWAIFSGLLDKKTLGKITVISSKTESRAKILELVEPDQLPEFLGGTQPDDTWQTSHFGPWGDEEIIKSLRDTNPHLPLELFELKCL